jgi:GH25 family lysozyme M1 (1,4-beta-N-acetylmuramidase)
VPRVWPLLVGFVLVVGQIGLAARDVAPADAALPKAVPVASVSMPIVLDSYTSLASGSAAPQRGVDVSSHQHPGGLPIDWNQVAAWGMDFAYIKATEGDTYVNPYFGEDWKAAGAAGLLRGAYHYARPRLPLWTATYDAQVFLLNTGPFTGVNDLPPVLDLEETGGLSGEDLVAWADAWMTEVSRQTGRWPMVYSASWFLDGTVGGAATLADHPMWVADYNELGYPQRLPAGWSRWTIWQFTASAQIPGISTPVDLNASCDLRARIQNPC